MNWGKGHTERRTRMHLSHLKAGSNRPKRLTSESGDTISSESNIGTGYATQQNQSK